MTKTAQTSSVFEKYDELFEENRKRGNLIFKIAVGIFVTVLLGFLAFIALGAWGAYVALSILL